MTTRLNFDFMILEQMSEGVILLNRNAQIVSFNRAAQPWIALCQSSVSKLKRLIQEDTFGRTQLPVSIDLGTRADSSPPNKPDAWLCKNGPSDYAVFVSAPPEKMQSGEDTLASRVTHQKIFWQIGEELRRHIAVMRALRNKPRNALPSTLSLLELQSERTDHTLQLISDLSQLMEREHPFSEDPIALGDLVENVLLLQPDAAKGGASWYTFQNNSSAHDPIYGSAAWLSYGLRVLMSELSRHAPARSLITLTLEQTGSTVILRGDTTHAEKTNGSAETQSLSLQMLLCRRIFELHAGKLHIETLATAEPADSGTSSGKIRSFTLAVPTGPHHPQNSLRNANTSMPSSLQTLDR